MIHEFTISNGLKVIGIESHKSPVVSVQIWTRNGSADERAGEEGLSHFIEHLVFKGTKNYVAGEIAARVEACGGEINAYTSFDQTVYYITISKNFYTEALKIISEMVATPLFDAAEVDREREVVIEEIKRSHDSLGRRASRLLFENFYHDHPYSIPVIGYEKNIRQVGVDQIRHFFSQRYVPDNMFLVVTGNFEGAELRSQVESTFGQQQNQPTQKPARFEPPPLVGKKVIVDQAAFEESVFYIAWPGIKMDHKDLAALECLMLIFGQGASSRLYRKLRQEKNLVNSIGAGMWAPSLAPGFLSISGSLNFDKLEPALAEIKTQIETLLKEGVTAAELQKAKTNFLAEEAYTIETVGGLARKYGGNFEATHDLYFHEKFHDQLHAVTVEHVLSVARKYFQSQNLLMTALVPKEQERIKDLFHKWTFTSLAASPVKLAVVPRSTAAIKKQQEKLKDGPVEEVIMANGLRFFSRQSQEAPVYNLRLAILGGSRCVDTAKAGLADLVGRVWSAQTKKRTESDIRERTDSLASSLYSFSGRNTFGMVVDGVSEYQSEMAELLSETLADFSISEDIIQREKASMLESLRSRKDSPSTIASLNFQKMLFKDHSYSQDPLGTPESVASLSGADVSQYLKNLLSSQNAVAALSGEFNLSIWQKALVPLSNKKIEDHHLKMTPLVPLQNDLYQFEAAAKEQTHIIYGFHGLSLDDPERFALQVLEAVLAGQGGRLFIELRDKASLAYSVSPLRMEGVGAGYFATYIGCSPEKTETAIKMMKEELNKMIEHPISKDELQRAQSYLIGGHDIGLQKNSSISSSIAFNEVYGNSYRELFDYGELVNKVTAEQVQNLAKRLFLQKSALSIVGPREPQ